MSKIPQEAMPVVEIIRKQVPKPEELPLLHNRGDIRRRRVLRWKESIGDHIMLYSPLGLLPTTIYAAPSNAYESGLPEEMCDAVQEFIEWWDEQTDAQAAVDAVWGAGRSE